MKLSEYHRQYEQIMKMAPGWERELAELMTMMEKEYRIPLLRDPEWEEKNRKVIALYRKISMSRTF